VTRQDTEWAIRPGRHGAVSEVTIVLSADTLWRVATRGSTVAAAAERTHFDGAHGLGLAAHALVSIIR
jgi:hypothetical protein